MGYHSVVQALLNVLEFSHFALSNVCGLSGFLAHRFVVFISEEEAVSSSSGQNARTLVDCGADEVCPTGFASATLLRSTKGGTLYDAQRRMIEAHGTRTVKMRLGPGGQSVGAEFRLTDVTSPFLSLEKLGGRQSAHHG